MKRNRTVLEEIRQIGIRRSIIRLVPEVVGGLNRTRCGTLGLAHRILSPRGNRHCHGRWLCANPVLAPCGPSQAEALSVQHMVDPRTDMT